MTKLLKWSVIFFIALLLVYNIDFHSFFYYLFHFRPIGLLLTLLAVFLSEVVVAYRWYFLNEKKMSFKSAFEAVMLSFFFNIFTPAKIGDLSKVYYLEKKESQHPIYTLSLTIVERFYDVIILGTLFAISLFFYFTQNMFLAFGLLVVFLGLFFYLITNSKLTLALIKHIPIKKVKILLYLVYKAVRARFRTHKFMTLFLLSVAVWIGYYFANYVFFLFATNLDLTFWQIFVVSTITFVVSAVPITPGSIGTFQAAMVFSLSWYGVPKEEALAVSIILHVLDNIPTLIVGFYLLGTKNFLWERENAAKKL